jgi:transposase
MAWRKLTTQQWEAIRVHLPQPTASPRGGRPRLEDRRCLKVSKKLHGESFLLGILLQGQPGRRGGLSVRIHGIRCMVMRTVGIP